MTSNIVLIGMPGAGKSTIGVLLAKETTRAFVDTDVLIQSREGKSLQEIVDTCGYMCLRQVEEDVIITHRYKHSVVATGGSAAYSRKAMEYLHRDGLIIHLDVSLAEIEKRVGNFAARGVAKRDDQTLADLYQERRSLYKQYADLAIICNGKTHREVLDEICQSIGSDLL